jgi:hypothetical protein
MVAHGLALDLVSWNNPFSRYLKYPKRRGMSLFPDVLDWLGGYPFEVAKPGEITGFYKTRGFALINSTLSKGGKGRGNNQYIFLKEIGPERSLRETPRVAREYTNRPPCRRFREPRFRLELLRAEQEIDSRISWTN